MLVPGYLHISQLLLSIKQNASGLREGLMRAGYFKAWLGIKVSTLGFCTASKPQLQCARKEHVLCPRPTCPDAKLTHLKTAGGLPPIARGPCTRRVRLQGISKPHATVD